MTGSEHTHLGVAYEVLNVFTICATVSLSSAIMLHEVRPGACSKERRMKNPWVRMSFIQDLGSRLTDGRTGER